MSRKREEESRTNVSDSKRLNIADHRMFASQRIANDEES